MSNMTITDNENKIKKMTKLIAENAVLKQKFQECDTYKNKFMKRNRELTKEIKELESKITENEQTNYNLHMRIKKVNFAKKTYGTVYEEKIL